MDKDEFKSDLSQKELQRLLEDAFSYESREKHEKAHLECLYRGTVPHGKRLYDVYTDKEKNVWYQVRVLAGAGPVSEYESVFGHPERKWWEERNEWLQKSWKNLAGNSADPSYVHSLLSNIRDMLGGPGTKESRTGSQNGQSRPVL